MIIDGESYITVTKSNQLAGVSHLKKLQIYETIIAEVLGYSSWPMAVRFRTVRV